MTKKRFAAYAIMFLTTVMSATTGMAMWIPGSFALLVAVLAVIRGRAYTRSMTYTPGGVSYRDRKVRGLALHVTSLSFGRNEYDEPHVSWIFTTLQGTGIWKVRGSRKQLTFTNMWGERFVSTSPETAIKLISAYDTVEAVHHALDREREQHTRYGVAIVAVRNAMVEEIITLATKIRDSKGSGSASRDFGRAERIRKALETYAIRYGADPKVFAIADARSTILDTRDALAGVLSSKSDS